MHFNFNYGARHDAKAAQAKTFCREIVPATDATIDGHVSCPHCRAKLAEQVGNLKNGDADPMMARAKRVTVRRLEAALAA